MIRWSANHLLYPLIDPCSIGSSIAPNWQRKVCSDYEEFSIRGFPPIGSDLLKEYALISDFFIKETNPGSEILYDSEKFQRELIFRKLSLRTEVFSLVLSPLSHESSTNKLNSAGYRYFTGAIFPEIVSLDGKVTVRNSLYCFETHFPFTALYRNLLSMIIGRFF